MNMVRCPRCTTEHRLSPESTGYLCAGCGEHWRFVRCADCGSVYHAAAGTESWTCNKCGRRNTGPGEDPSDTGTGRPRRAQTGWSRLSDRGRLLVVVVPILVAAVLIAVLSSIGGNGDEGGSTKSPELVAARRTYCRDLAELQAGFRLPALDRFLTDVERDIGLYRAAGVTAPIEDLLTIQTAAGDLRAALERNNGVGPATTSLEEAIANGPPC